MIYQGDAKTILKTLPDESIDCCVTSPPFWGLRDYGVEALIWGGKEGCQHNFDLQKITTGQTHWNSGGKVINPEDRKVRDGQKREFGFCSKCGAWKGCYGLEPTPELYIKNSVMIFREVRRVLKKTGTLWINIGDSYTTGGCGGHQKPDMGGNPRSFHGHRPRQGDRIPRSVAPPGLKSKDLVGIPWMLAFALRADGWYLRQDIIWHKPNPMPESVTDRCTKAHEYIFLLSKAQKYYFDADGIKEKSTSGDSVHVVKYPKGAKNIEASKQLGGQTRFTKTWVNTPTRNKRSVWTVTTKPFKEAHFATFPEDLILPCVLAGCPQGGVVLDPFFGAGTTGVVAKKNFRDYIGIELNPKYVEMAKRRIEAVGMF